jgi:hypothetical protein
MKLFKVFILSLQINNLPMLRMMKNVILKLMFIYNIQEAKGE